VPVKTRVRVARLRDGFYGYCNRLEDRCVISIASELVNDTLLSIAFDTLFHEWAHAITIRLELLGHPKDVEHPDEGGMWNWRIHRAWHDEGGQADADEYSPRPWR
jgi:hypothetical protein